MGSSRAAEAGKTPASLASRAARRPAHRLVAGIAGGSVFTGGVGMIFPAIAFFLRLPPRDMEGVDARDGTPGAALSAPPLPRRACTPPSRSEEHTSELQSPTNLVCRLLL